MRCSSRATSSHNDAVLKLCRKPQQSRPVLLREAKWTAGVELGEGLTPSYMSMSHVLSPMSWIDHWCHIWQWLTAPVIAVFALGEEQTTVARPRVWNRLAFLNYPEIQLWILHYRAQWSRFAWIPVSFLTNGRDHFHSWQDGVMTKQTPATISECCLRTSTCNWYATFNSAPFSRHDSSLCDSSSFVQLWEVWHEYLQHNAA